MIDRKTQLEDFFKNIPFGVTDIPPSIHGIEGYVTRNKVKGKNGKTLIVNKLIAINKPSIDLVLKIIDDKIPFQEITKVSFPMVLNPFLVRILKEHGYKEGVFKYRIDDPKQHLKPKETNNYITAKGFFKSY